MPGPGPARAAQAQQHRQQRPAQPRDGDEGGHGQRDAGGQAHGVAAQRTGQLDARGNNQPRRHRAHAAQGALGYIVIGHAGKADRQRQHHQRGQQQHARQRGGRAGQAKVAVADHHRQVDHVGAGHDLRHGPVFDELLARHPALFLDQLTLHHGQHAAKALQCQPGERPEQVAARARGVQRRGRLSRGSALGSGRVGRHAGTSKNVAAGAGAAGAGG